MVYLKRDITFLIFKEKSQRIKELEKKSSTNLNEFVTKKFVEQQQQRNKSVDNDTFDFSSRKCFCLFFGIFKNLYFLALISFLSFFSFS